jgi:hypothetical protein
MTKSTKMAAVAMVQYFLGQCIYRWTPLRMGVQKTYIVKRLQPLTITATNKGLCQNLPHNLNAYLKAFKSLSHDLNSQ